MTIFLTAYEEYGEFPDIQREEDYIFANDVVLEAKFDYYQCGYMNALTTQHR